MPKSTGYRIAELEVHAEDCWRRVRDQVDGIDLTMPVYPDPLWTVRDILIHCAFWNDEANKAIDAHLNGDSYQTETGATTFDEGLDAMNQRVVEVSRSLPEDDVRQRWIASQDGLVEAVRSLNAAAFARDITCPWHDTMPVEDMVMSEVGHEEEHFKHVQAAVEARG